MGMGLWNVANLGKTKLLGWRGTTMHIIVDGSPINRAAIKIPIEHFSKTPNLLVALPGMASPNSISFSNRFLGKKKKSKCAAGAIIYLQSAQATLSHSLPNTASARTG